MIYCTRSRFSATHANTVEKLYANSKVNSKPPQGMQLLGCRCSVRFFEEALCGGRVRWDARYRLATLAVHGFIAGNKKGLESQGLSSSLWSGGDSNQALQAAYFVKWGAVWFLIYSQIYSLFFLCLPKHEFWGSKKRVPPVVRPWPQR